MPKICKLSALPEETFIICYDTENSDNIYNCIPINKKNITKEIISEELKSFNEYDKFEFLDSSYSNYNEFINAFCEKYKID